MRADNNRFRQALAEAIAECGKTRNQIVAAINEVTGRDLSKTMLDKYLSANSNYSLPSECLPLFCRITGSNKPFKILLEEIGCGLTSPSDRDRDRLATLEEESRRVLAKADKLKLKLGLQVKP